MATTKGRRRPKAERERISQKQKENFLKREAEYVAQPTEKKCSVCGKRKPIDEFYKKKRTLASGVVKSYPAAECKSCHKDRIDKNIAKLKREGKYTKLNRKRYRKKIKTHGREKIREQQREAATFRRDEEGRLRGYFRTVTNQNGKIGKVDRMPLVRFVEAEIERRGLSYEDIAKSVENLTAARISWIMQGEEPAPKTKAGVVKLDWISLHRVDQILRGLDQEHQLTILYTDEVIDAGLKAQAQEVAEKAAEAEERRSQKAKERYARKKKERGSASPSETQTQPDPGAA